MSVQAETTCTLSSDIFYDILRRLDGATLASAACTCATFSSISKEERIWENVCNSVWPSTNRDDVRNLLSSIGGFRKFFSDCYPLIVNKDLALVPLDSFLEDLEEWPEADYYEEDSEEYDNIKPFDFVSLVDITYNEKSIFSEVLWGISESDNLGRWFYNSPFHVDLANSDVNDNVKKVIISQEHGLPPIESIDTERKEGKISAELQDKLKLSWIIINKKVNRAANLSSLIPLGVQRHWEDKNFVVRFGSVLPAEDILPYQVVECILLVKFRMFNDSISAYVNLELTHVSMQLEDMEGYHVNGRNSLMVLKKALSCTKSRNYSEVLELCNLYSRVRSEIKEEKMRNESRIDKMCILSGILAVVMFWFCLL